MWCSLASAWAADQAVATFTLSDQLNRTWEHELVFYPVADNVFGRDDLMLLGPDDKPVVHQWVPAEVAASGKKSLAFFATVPAFGSAAYRLVPGTPVRDTDLRVAESQNAVSLENRLTGIRLGGLGRGHRRTGGRHPFGSGPVDRRRSAGDAGQTAAN